MRLQISSDFPGGNIVVDDIGDDEVCLHQDLRDTSHDWFYWCFRVLGAGGQKLHFRFTRSRAIGVRGPAVSRDAGETWSWLGLAAIRDNGFVYDFPEDADEVRFSFAMPYQLAHWQRFMDRLLGNRWLSRHRLCRTRQGREAEYLLLGEPEVEPQHRIAIACRHHCCEMMTSYALEGLLDWVARAADPDAAWLRRNVQFLIIPFADLDGVENGDQGKDRQPRDHGRDYQGRSLYAETAAIRELVPQWAEGKLHVALDLHCPWIAGQHSEEIYLVGSGCAAISEQQRRFSSLLEGICFGVMPFSVISGGGWRGTLPFAAQNFLPFGTDWNIPANYSGGQGFSRWAETLPGIRLATSIEIPYANAGGQEVNQNTARAFGRDLALAIKESLA